MATADDVEEDELGDVTAVPLKPYPYMLSLPPLPQYSVSLLLQVILQEDASVDAAPAAKELPQ